VIRTRNLADIVRRILLLLVVITVGIVLWRNWDEVAPQISAVSPGAWLAAAVLALLSPFLTMLGWRRVLADLGSQLSPANAASVFMVGQLGKYVPGSLWSVLVQTEMARRLNVPRRRTAVVGLIAIAMALLTGVGLGLPAIPALADLGERTTLVLLGLSAVGLVVVLYPPVLNRLIGAGLRLIRRGSLEHDLSGAAIVQMAVWFLLSWVATGAAMWVLARELVEPGADTPYLWLVCITGFALASSLGMLSIVIPAGAGVREALLVILLVGMLSAPAAAAVAILVRFLTVITDIVWALSGWLWGRAHRLTGPVELER